MTALARKAATLARKIAESPDSFTYETDEDGNFTSAELKPLPKKDDGETPTEVAPEPPSEVEPVRAEKPSTMKERISRVTRKPRG